MKLFKSISYGRVTSWTLLCQPSKKKAKTVSFSISFFSLSRININTKASFVTPSLSYTHPFLQRVFIWHLFVFFLWGRDSSSGCLLLLVLPPRWFLFQRTQHSEPPLDCNHIGEPYEGCGWYPHRDTPSF